jgi:hypothetical protein
MFIPSGASASKQTGLVSGSGPLAAASLAGHVARMSLNARAKLSALASLARCWRLVEGTTMCTFLCTLSRQKGSDIPSAEYSTLPALEGERVASFPS